MVAEDGEKNLHSDKKATNQKEAAAEKAVKQEIHPARIKTARIQNVVSL